MLYVNWAHELWVGGHGHLITRRISSACGVKQPSRVAAGATEHDYVNPLMKPNFGDHS
jgi:hypothetical protein